MSGTGQRRRVERLERGRRGEERLRVAEWWPGEPRPEAEGGELLVVLRRHGPRPAPVAAPDGEGGGA